MNEHLSNLPEPSNEQELQIDHLVDTQGMSYAEALEHVLGRDAAVASRQASRNVHPSNFTPRRSRAPYVRPAVGEDSFPTIDTTGMTEQQRAANAAGKEALSRVFDQHAEATMSPEEYKYYKLRKLAQRLREE